MRRLLIAGGIANIEPDCNMPGSRTSRPKPLISVSAVLALSLSLFLDVDKRTKGKVMLQKVKREQVQEHFPSSIEHSDWLLHTND